MRIMRSVGAKITAAIATATAAIALTAAPSAFAATQGTATLQGAGNATLTSGTLTTPFLIGLSAPGVCSGTSSTSPNYFVYGFIVPVPSGSTTLAQEMAGVNWSGGAGSSYYPVYYDSALDQYGPANTSTTGQPIAPSSGSFQFQYTQTALTNAGITPTLLNNTWEVGLACETGNATVDYWTVQVTFDANGNWTTSSSVAAPEFPAAIVVPVAGIGVLGGGLILARRRNRSHASAA